MSHHSHPLELQRVCETCGDRYAVTYTHDIALSAIAIADEACRSDVECHGLGDASSLKSGRYGLTDDHEGEVRTLKKARAVLREAFQYLHARGLADLVTDTHGEQIQLHLERFA